MFPSTTRPLLVLTLISSLAASARAADWPAFRGESGSGNTVSQDTGFPVEWSPTKNVRWGVALPNRGNESPIVSQGRVFVTSATDDGRERRLHCIDRRDGTELWTKSVTFDAAEPTHQTNPFGAATPASDGTHVVVWHGSAGLFCYDFEGNQVWKADLGKVGHVWGYGSSPVLHDGKVILNFGPGEEQFVVAVNLSSGDVVWKHTEPGGSNAGGGKLAGSWSTPVIMDVDGAEQVICALPTRIVALNPVDGSLIWFCEGLTGRNGSLVYTSPLVSGDIVVAMGGYTGPAIAVRAGGTGDVTASRRLWRDDQKQPQRIGSGVIIGDKIFMANAGPGFIQCLNLETGEEVWRDRGPGGDHWGAMVLAGGHLYVTNQAGATLVMAPNAEKFEQVASNQMKEPSNSTPAFSDGQIFLRTAKHLYCIAQE